ncbi:MAG: hypothetical protein M9952_11690 [Microthrixaceae bacterium]|nr:hypothetical protein [Microthrixaceae bacterium]
MGITGRITAVFALVCCGFVAGSAAAEASCVPPSIDVVPAYGAPGDRITVFGEAWATSCDDVVPLPEGQEPARAVENIDITMWNYTGVSRPTSVATASANDQFQFRTSFVIPDDVPAGVTTLNASQGYTHYAGTDFFITRAGALAPTTTLFGEPVSTLPTVDTTAAPAPSTSAAPTTTTTETAPTSAAAKASTSRAPDDERAGAAPMTSDSGVSPGWIVVAVLGSAGAAGAVLWRLDRLRRR